MLAVLRIASGAIKPGRTPVPGKNAPTVRDTMSQRCLSVAVLRGKVVSGIGNFSYWIAKLHAHYRLKTGMDLFPGTLNVQLAEPFSMPAGVLRLEGWEYDGTVSVSLLPCRIQDRRAFILRTDKNEKGEGDHPKTIVEIATDVKLRDHFYLADGDLVEIEIFDEPSSSIESK